MIILYWFNFLYIEVNLENMEILLGFLRNGWFELFFCIIGVKIFFIRSLVFYLVDLIGNVRVVILVLY